MDTATFLQAHPVFSLGEAQAALGLTAEAARDRLKYQASRGRLQFLGRGVYASVPPGVAANSFRADPILAAAATRPDAIFSHHTALELLGAAHSVWSVVTAYTDRRRSPMELDGAQIRFLDHPTVLSRQGKAHLGVREVRRADRVLQVTGPERTLVDGLRRLDLAGGLEELVVSASGFAVLDLELLREILLAYESKSLWAASGWFLERYQRTFYVSDQYLAELEGQRPRSPHYLERDRRGGELQPRWNLIVPEALGRASEPDEA